MNYMDDDVLWGKDGNELNPSFTDYMLLTVPSVSQWKICTAEIILAV